jgi:hypothetical protein
MAINSDNELVLRARQDSQQRWLDLDTRVFNNRLFLERFVYPFVTLIYLCSLLELQLRNVTYYYP